MAAAGERGAPLRGRCQPVGGLPVGRPAERHVRRGGPSLPGLCPRRDVAAVRRLGRPQDHARHRGGPPLRRRAALGGGRGPMSAPYVFGVIPARGGSKGLPGKNLKRLGALSLIGHAVAGAREARTLTRFIVSTDSVEIADEARRHGAEAPFLRPSELASDEAGMVPVLQHAVRWLESSGGPRPTHVVTIQPTSPFRVGADIDRTVDKAVATGADSAQTVTEVAYPPFFMKTLDGDRTVPLFLDGHKYVRRQDTPVVYQPS